MSDSDKSAALIIGNGPSVDLLDPALLDQFTTFGCNHIYKKFPDWKRPTDNVLITDSHRLEEIRDAYANYPGKLYVGHERYAHPPAARIRSLLGREFVPLRQITKPLASRIPFAESIGWPPSFCGMMFDRARYTFDLEQGLNFGCSVVFSAIQVAVIQGFRTILLTGVDTSYTKPVDYFAGMTGNISYVNHVFIKNPRLYMEPLMVILQIYLEELGVELFDCTPGGKLRFINKATFQSEPPYYRATGPQQFPEKRAASDPIHGQNQIAG